MLTLNRVDWSQASIPTGSAQSDELRILRDGPFVGPRAFSGGEGALLFGRHNEERQLADQIAAGSLTVVYGESGVGKSSLLSARLPLALQQIDPNWLVIGFSQWQQGFEGELSAEIARIINGQRRGRLFGHRLLALAQLKRIPVVLIFDQFEEYFLYHKHANETFEAELASLANLRNSPVRLVLSLRDDELFRLARLREHIPDVYRSLFHVEPLDRRGSTDAITMPIRAYNDIAAKNGRPDLCVPEPDPELVEALVRGADQLAIRRRLHLGGRGTTQDTAGRRQIVAPFLQLALETLWSRDVVGRRAQGVPARGLQLATLMALAGLKNGGASSEAVGRLAERHVDSVLSQLSDREQQVCSSMLTSMITPSGSKVSIRVPLDLERQLSSADYEIAIHLAKSLATKDRERLFRHVAADDEASPQDGENAASLGAITDAKDNSRYEILHDALAVPLLNWVARWEHQHELAKAERRRRRQIFLVGLAAIFASVIAAITVATYFSVTRAHESKRLLQIAKEDNAPEFRERILLALSSSKLTGAWMPWDNKIEDVEARIQTMLRAAPEMGGRFTAVGVDPSGHRFVWLKELKDGSFWGICVHGTRQCDTSPDRNTIFPTTNTRSRSEKLLSAFGAVSVGFIDGITEPVLYRRGILNYRTDGGWVQLDLAPYLTVQMREQPGWISVEILFGEVQIRFMSIPDRITQLVRLQWYEGEDGPFVYAAPPAMVTWAPDEAIPAVASNGTLSANVMLDPPHPTAHQVIRNVVKLTDLSAVNPADPVAPAGDGDPVTQVGLQAPPSLAFSRRATDAPRDGALVWRRRGSLLILPVRAGRISESRSVVHISPQPFRNAEFPIMGPLLAAAEHRSGNRGSLRVAWLSPGGAVLADITNDLKTSETGIVGSTRELTTGIDDGGYRLEFSADARFLILRQMLMDKNEQTIRVWDLDAEYSSVKGPNLVSHACRIAAIEDDGRHYTSREILTIFNGDAPAETCP